MRRRRMSQEKSKGFIVVASNKKNFYHYAINLIDSIRDHYADNEGVEQPQITLVCEPWMVDHRAEELADNIIHCDNHYRAKLWGMAQSPYDLTMYIDADMECEHKDICKVFDEIEDADMVFAELTDDREYIYAERHFDTPEGKSKFRLCGGVCLYDMSKPIVREFMQDWWELTREQMGKRWWPEGYVESLRSWDQFSLWWLTERDEKYKDKVNIKIFNDDLRWNYYNAFQWHRTRPKDPVILRHYSCGLNKDGCIV